MTSSRLHIRAGTLDSWIQHIKKDQEPEIKKEFVESGKEENIVPAKVEEPREELLIEEQDGSSPKPCQSHEAFESPSVSPSLPANHFHRDVKTPDWKKDDEDITAKPEAICETLESTCELHWKLEVLEARIHDGVDKLHEHPAQILEIFQNEGLNNATDTEKKSRNCYQAQSQRNIRPLFWKADRVYDRSYEILDSSNSALLVEKMRNSYKGPLEDDECPKKKRIHTKKYEIDEMSEPEVQNKKLKTSHQARNSHQAPKRRLLIVKFSSKLFDTDESDDMTDPCDEW